jgi:hypothetical protein
MVPQFLSPQGFKESWPAWTRTMNNGSKGRCVTITPQASDEGIAWLKVGLGASLGILNFGFEI